MNKKNRIHILVLIFTILIIVLIPTDVVWGGQNFQTVPIVPPSATITFTSTESPTETPTTTTIKTSTQPANTLTPTQLPSKTNTFMKPTTITSTPTKEVVTQPVGTNISRLLLIGLGIIIVLGVVLIPITIYILRKRKST
jgi:hypothetical protein